MVSKRHSKNRDERTIYRRQEGVGQQTIYYAARPIEGVYDEIRYGEETDALVERAVIAHLTETEGESPHHEMAGGYPYDVIERVDNDEVLIPGLGAQARLNDCAPHGRRDVWGEVHCRTTQDGNEVLLGQLSDKYYILDPTTHMAITPAFGWLQEINSQRALVSLHDLSDRYVYEISASPAIGEDIKQKNLHHAYGNYPEFLLHDKLSIIRQEEAVLASIQPYQGPAVSELGPVGSFGLESDTDATAAYGRSVFSDSLAKIVEYTSFDKAAFSEFRRPDTVMRLPYIESARIAAELQLTTDKDGAVSIRLADHDTIGFYLVQDAAGYVTITDRELQRTLTDSDDDYCQYINQAGVLIAVYIDRLYKEQSEASAQELIELRRKMGEGSLRAWSARRKMKKMMTRSRNNL